jgi:hypothetical protein
MFVPEHIGTLCGIATYRSGLVGVHFPADIVGSLSVLLILVRVLSQRIDWFVTVSTGDSKIKKKEEKAAKVARQIDPNSEVRHVPSTCGLRPIESKAGCSPAP